MPALADYLKTTLDDSLKKLVQPAGIIPAALLVMLNLAFVLPVAAENEVAVAATYSGLSDGSKILVVATVILVVGFLFANSTSAALDTLCGRTWAASLLARRLSRRRLEQRTRLEKRMEAAKRNDDIEQFRDLDWRRRTRYSNGEECAATALGDALRAYEDDVEARYGLKLAALWEPIRAAAPPEDAAAKAAADEKSSLDVTANLTLTGGLFALEVIVLFSLWSRPGGVLLASAGLAVVYLGYRVTVAKSVSWCDAMDTVMALYIDDALEKLGTRECGSIAARRTLLAELSEFLLRNGPAEGIFDEPGPSAAPTVTASAGVSVQVAEAALPFRAGAMATEHRDEREYVLIVSREAATASILKRPATVLFTDARLPRLSTPVAPDGTTCAVLRNGRRAGGDDTLVWTVAGLAAGEARAVRFRLDRWYFAVSDGLEVEVEPTGSAFNLTIENPKTTSITGKLSAFHCDDGTSGRLQPLNPTPELRREKDEDGRRVWTVGPLEGGARLVVALRLTPSPMPVAA